MSSRRELERAIAVEEERLQRLGAELIDARARLAALQRELAEVYQ